MNSDFMGALKHLEKEKGIPYELIVEALKEALVVAYKKKYGQNQNIIIEIDKETGELGIWHRKLVVERLEDPENELSLEEAEELYDGVELGMELDLEIPNVDLTRIAAMTTKQVISNRIREFERDLIYGKYTDREGEVVNVIAQRYERRFVPEEYRSPHVRSNDRGEERVCVVELDKAEGIIPISQQSKNEWFRTGDRIKCYLVEMVTTNGVPQLILSRNAPTFLKKLFEREVPEIRLGTIQVKAVVREAGFRSKIAVFSVDGSIDPVGACVGPKGSRVQAVVDELRGEKIDVIPWSEDQITFIANSLQPARVSRVTLYEEDHSAVVVVPDNELSLAIGKEGQNARLAAKLTGWKIDIASESDYLSSRDGDQEKSEDEVTESEVSSETESTVAEETDEVTEVKSELEDEPKVEKSSEEESSNEADNEA